MRLNGHSLTRVLNLANKRRQHLEARLYPFKTYTSQEAPRRITLLPFPAIGVAMRTGLHSTMALVANSTGLSYAR
jgi:hypothetical protein